MKSRRIRIRLTISSFYYQSVRQALDTKANLVSGLVVRLMDDKNVDISSEIRSIVETFSDRDEMELMALNHEGKVILTSSGFSYIDSLEMPDYKEAVSSQSGKGYYVGTLESGEKVMAVTVLVPVINSEFNAMRLMVSMQKIDTQLIMAVLLFTVLCIFILLFVIVSGLYFIKSIVIPIREVGGAARRIASGDLEVRIEKKHDDELGG